MTRPLLHLVQGFGDPSVERRTCRLCGNEGPRAELFPKSGRVCKACVAKRTAAWVAANPERARASQRATYAEHRETRNAKATAYYHANAAIISAKRKELYLGPKGDEVRAANASYRREHADELNEKKRAERRETPSRVMLRDARKRAKALGVPFTITEADIIVPPCCPVLGIPLFVGTQGARGACPNSPSLDRVVPELGYVPGNVAVISWRANRLKSDGTAEEHERVAAWVRATTGKDERDA